MVSKQVFGLRFKSIAHFRNLLLLCAAAGMSSALTKVLLWHLALSNEWYVLVAGIAIALVLIGVLFLALRRLLEEFTARDAMLRRQTLALIVGSATIAMLLALSDRYTLTWRWAVGPHSGEIAPVFSGTSWDGAVRRVIELHATYDPEVMTHGVWRAIADLPIVSKMMPVTLELWVTQPSWAVIDPMTNAPWTTYDGVDVFVRVEKGGAIFREQRVALDPPLTADQRSWHHIVVSIPAGAERLSVEVAMRQAADYDRVWITEAVAQPIWDVGVGRLGWIAAFIMAFVVSTLVSLKGTSLLVWAARLLAHRSYFLVFLALVFLTSLVRPVDYVDDAWITFRYANNLATKGELVFNEGERVEGISNLLWTLVLALSSWTFRVPVPLLAGYCAIVLWAYFIYRIWRIGVILQVNSRLALIPSIISLLDINFWGSIKIGLENSMFVSILADIVYFYLRGRFFWASLMMGLLFLVRIESLIVSLSFGFLILKNNKGNTRFFPAIFYLSVVFAATLFRLLYFGDFIPNSVIAKSFTPTWFTISLGSNYVLEFIQRNLVWSTLLTTSMAYIVFISAKEKFWHFYRKQITDTNNQLLIVSNLTIIASFVVVLRNGGDWMPHYRLLFLYGPLYCVIFVILLKKKVISSYLGIAIITFSSFSFFTDFWHLLKQGTSYHFVNFQTSAFWKDTVEALSPVLSSSDVVSSEGIGYVGYFLPNTYIHDPFGLVDSHLAKKWRSRTKLR